MAMEQRNRATRHSISLAVAKATERMLLSREIALIREKPLVHTVLVRGRRATRSKSSKFLRKAVNAHALADCIFNFFHEVRYVSTLLPSAMAYIVGTLDRLKPAGTKHRAYRFLALSYTFDLVAVTSRRYWT